MSTRRDGNGPIDTGAPSQWTSARRWVPWVTAVSVLVLASLVLALSRPLAGRMTHVQREEQAAREAEALLAKAVQEAEETRSAAVREAKELRAKAVQEATEIRERAFLEAKALLNKAVRQAEALRGRFEGQSSITAGAPPEAMPGPTGAGARPGRATKGNNDDLGISRSNPDLRGAEPARTTKGDKDDIDDDWKKK